VKSLSVRRIISVSVLAVGFATSILPTIVETAPSGASASTVAPCASDQLWAAYLNTAGATGNLIYSFVFINIGSNSCRLAGYPTVRGYKDNHVYPLRITQHGTFAGNLSPTVLKPRETGELLISTSDFCNALNIGGQTKIRRIEAKDTYTGLEIDGPNRSWSQTLSGFSIDIACGLEVSQLGWRPL
jgi:hypothetical protein